MVPGLWQVFRDFSVVGLFSFGGHMAMIAHVRRTVVERNNWIAEEAFSEAVTLASALPGPAAVNVVAWCGYRLKGWLGAWFTVASVLWPSVLMMVVLSSVYSVVLGWDRLEYVLLYMRLAVGALIISAGIRFISPPGKFWPGPGLGVMKWAVLMVTVTVLFAWPGYWTMLFLFAGFAAFGQVLPTEVRANPTSGNVLTAGDSRNSIGGWLASGVVYFGLAVVLYFLRNDLFNVLLIFSKVAVTLFGGAYVVVPILKGELVDGLNLISDSDLLVGISLGQITPGPLLVCVVFYGVKIAGIWGGLVAAMGMFFPTAWLMVWISRHALVFNRFRFWGRAMAMIRPCVAGMILYAGVSLLGGLADAGGLTEVIFFAGSFCFIHFSKWSPAWMMVLAMLMSVLPL